MSHAVTDEPENKMPRVWQPHEPLKPSQKKCVQFQSNANLYNQIVEIANSSRTSISAIVRKLLYMGLREYELNHIAGRKKKDIEADYNKRLAEAQALAAQREARKQARNKNKSSVVPAVTVMLAGTDESEE